MADTALHECVDVLRMAEGGRSSKKFDEALNDVSDVYIDQWTTDTTFVHDDDVGLSREDKLRKYDLTNNLSLFWDPEMLRVVLQWLKDSKIYAHEDVDTPIIKTLKYTYNPILWATYQKDRPLDHIAQEERDNELFHKLESYLLHFVTCMTKLKTESKLNKTLLEERKTLKEWATWYHKSLLVTGVITPGTQIQFAPDSGEQMLKYCHIHYLNGRFDMAAKWLSFFVDYICEFTVEGLNFDRKQSAYWGLFASQILLLPTPIRITNGFNVETLNIMCPEEGKRRGVMMANVFANGNIDEWDAVAADLAYHIIRFDEYLEQHYTSEQVIVPVGDEDPADSLAAGKSAGSGPKQLSGVEAINHNKMLKDELVVRRSWLLHWAIWPIFRYFTPLLTVGGKEYIPQYDVWNDLINWFFGEKNINTVLLVAPWLLRYFSVLAILNGNGDDNFNAVCQMVSTASQNKDYSDPFVSLLEALFVDFNFEKAQKTLRECSVAAEADFFLSPLLLPIEENARLIIFETYCRIHKCINIDMIANKLNMTSETAEKWIMNLIRRSKLDAKIDSQRNRVEVTTEPPNIYQRVVEKTQHVASRTNALIQNMEKPAGGDRGEGDYRRRGNFPNRGLGPRGMTGSRVRG